MAHTASKIALAAALLATACGYRSGDDRKEATMGQASLRVQSSAFEDGGAIPAKYSADGENVSPPLSWSPGPKGTSHYALVVDDPDAPAGTWVHWIVWNLETTRLEENAWANGKLAGAVQGLNSWRKAGWGGPEPPSGTHRYFFRVYALDRAIDLDQGADRAALDRAISGHQLATGALMGRYSKK